MMPTRYEKRAGVIGCPYSIKCAVLKVKMSVNILFFKCNAKYINYHTFSGIPLTPRLQKVIFFSPTAKNVLSKCRVAIAGLKCCHFNESEERA